MALPAAYIAIVLIWSTTPLAVKWSAVEAGFLFAVLSRMLIAAVFCQLLTHVLRSDWHWHKRALSMYLLSGFNISFSMLLIYWGAQTISSGLIALLFGLMPLITGVFASLILKEKSFSPEKLLGIMIAFAGLVIIFYSEQTQQEGYLLAIAAILAAISWHSFSTVVFKRYASDLPIMSVTTASIWVSVIFLSIAWWFSGKSIPMAISEAGWGSILYLSIVASVLGFTIYFYVLKNMQASTVALIPLMTPVLALLLGQYLNNEQADSEVWLGALFIVTGLSMYQLNHFLKKLSRKLFVIIKP